MSQSTIRTSYFNDESRQLIDQEAGQLLSRLISYSSQLVGRVKSVEARVRRFYQVHSSAICLAALIAMIALGYVGHMTSVLALGG